MLDNVIASVIKARDHSTEMEKVIFVDEDRGMFAYKAPFSLLRDRLPINCRFVPDYAELRKNGLIAGAAISGLLLFFSIVIGIKYSVTGGTYLGILSVLTLPLLGITGWNYGPNAPIHDYRPFWLIRLMVREEEPHGAVGSSTVDVPEGHRRWMVPYSHSFLNLRSVSEEQQDVEYTPHVMRATTLHADSLMLDEKQLIKSTHKDKWEKIKAGSLITLIFAELVAVFFLVAVIQ